MTRCPMPSPSLKSRSGLRLICLEETASTNDYLRLHAKELQDPVTLALAEHQTKGRGATGAWLSERGANLLFSLLTHPATLEAKDIFLLSQMACLAVCRGLETLCAGKGFSIKWPNDVYWGEGKLAGILIENELTGKRVADCVTGIGVNVNQTSFSTELPNPTSLAVIEGRQLDRALVLEAIVEQYSSLYKALCQGDCEGIREGYLKRLFRKGERHGYKDGEGEFRATLETVEPSGHIVLIDDEGRRRRYAFKEVQHII
ncbi:MAG: biotin--[acetyl-CoA-carboxylase] ligase [Prevotellaceae bacterium]|nr:biotin--[acetyl-CoA-carboxylase] ligase [Prevotellaceae bacterium]